MTWTKSTPVFRAEEVFGTFRVLIHQDHLGMIQDKSYTLSGSFSIQGVDEWVEFANWILEQARLYKEGPNDESNT